jgi:hypothetical protein
MPAAKLTWASAYTPMDGEIVAGDIVCVIMSPLEAAMAVAVPALP